ncbi:DUF6197 family protein [Streptomyces sp. Inha503]|uniref:DUF6197 family protein n=1 Tax=Streptomyces sp. Inha503 TaxID=3383314 RepID=UPI0039A3C85C
MKESHPTPARILTALANHIEHVGLYQGEEPWQPGKLGDTPPRTVLHAWDRGMRAVKPHWSARGEPWDILHCARRTLGIDITVAVKVAASRRRMLGRLRSRGQPPELESLTPTDVSFR